MKKRNIKRLLKNKKHLFKTSKLTKQADWIDVNVYQNDIINIITDAISQQSVIKVNYAGSGWRNILPYGWYTSKDNNILLYCYKENSAIRSYRLDKVINLMIDDKLDTDFNKQQENDILDFEILELPENNEEILEISENEQGAETPFDESIEMLEDTMIEDNNMNDNNLFNSDFNTNTDINNINFNNNDINNNDFNNNDFNNDNFNNNQF